MYCAAMLSSLLHCTMYYNEWTAAAAERMLLWRRRQMTRADASPAGFSQCVRETLDTGCNVHIASSYFRCVRHILVYAGWPWRDFTVPRVCQLSRRHVWGKRRDFDIPRLMSWWSKYKKTLLDWVSHNYSSWVNFERKLNTNNEHLLSNSAVYSNTQSK